MSAVIPSRLGGEAEPREPGRLGEELGVRTRSGQDLRLVIGRAVQRHRDGDAVALMSLGNQAHEAPPTSSPNSPT